MRRVVITGQGAVCALGMSAPTTMESMREGRVGIGPLDFRDVDRLTIKIGGQIKGYAAEDHFSPKEIALFDPFTQFAMLAAEEAVEQAGLEIDDALAEKVLKHWAANRAICGFYASLTLQTARRSGRSVDAMKHPIVD